MYIALEDRTTPIPRRRAASAVRLKGLGVATPPYQLPQAQAREIAARIFKDRYKDFSRLAKSFASSGVERRYTVAPLEWFETPKTWPERAALYEEGASRLFMDAARAALAEADWRADEIDTIVTVTSTGVATPTIDARVLRRMGFRTDVKRVPVFGLGCAGGVSGLAIARDLAQGAPGSKVLMVAVETCSLNFREDRLQKADIIAAVLFADGAAAACLASEEPDGGGAVTLGQSAQHLWPDTLGIMGWDVDQNGFGVVFDRAIPRFVETEFRAAAETSLARLGLTAGAVARFVCHPGGAKVLEALEGALALRSESLDHERGVLRDYGNMSAPTVLFVLNRVLKGGAPAGNVVLAALGPGFTASFLACEIGA